jgi:hypothetical protein
LLLLFNLALHYLIDVMYAAGSGSAIGEIQGWDPRDGRPGAAGPVPVE